MTYPDVWPQAPLPQVQTPAAYVMSHEASEPAPGLRSKLIFLVGNEREIHDVPVEQIGAVLPIHERERVRRELRALPQDMYRLPRHAQARIPRGNSRPASAR